MKTKKSEQLITKDMSISEVISKYPETIPALMKTGMHCLGCPMAMSESLGEGLSAHGLDADKIIEELNKVARKK